MAAYGAAIGDMADAIETDLVMTGDGVLICRHESELSKTTDVAAHVEFSERKRTKLVSGHRVTGWFSEDFTLAEIKTLRAVTRSASLRRASARFDQDFSIPTLDELLELTTTHTSPSGAPLVLMPEIKEASRFRELGLAPEATLQARLSAYGLGGPGAPVIVQSFSPSSLAITGSISPLRRALIVIRRARLTNSYLRRYRGRYYALFVRWSTVIPVNSSGWALRPTTVVARAKAHGLQVAIWTLAPENAHLPRQYRVGSDPAGAGDLSRFSARFFALGVDGVITDSPGIVVPARDLFSSPG